ncbi:rhomboid family intramembrane serine protease [Thermoleophilia bacterium SCSIO 60948]|nr:rhomboid family intramembrane serine protease [Thermoleophilia bacterium SCSIO 60948]
MTDIETATTCYRHPDRETRVACSNCGRPICPDCMIPTPVGMRCPECAREKTQVRRLQSGPSRQSMPGTYALIAICVIAFLGEIATGSGSTLFNGYSTLTFNGAMNAGLVADGEWYRIITNAFLHYGIIHLGLNMLVLYFLGAYFESSIGTARFVGLFFVAALGGSLGVALISPESFSAGASGGVFGLLAAGFLIARRRGLEMVAQQIGFLLLLNLGFTFIGRGISIGGHLGGLALGALAAMLLLYFERSRVPNRGLIEAALLIALAVATAVATVAVSVSIAG